VAQHQFGVWTVDTEALEIRCKVFPDRAYIYPIPLDNLLDPGRILDMLAQVSWKTWGTPEVVGNLLKAMDYCIGLQENVCGSGISYETTLDNIKARLKNPPRP
jgi:hypothetical protein